jgi:hypothetical protein
MIAKAKVISHGSTAVNYAAKKKLVDVLQFHLLPEGISSAAVWSRMMTLQEQFRGKLNQHRPLELTSIRIEVSPAREESVGWTLDDWRKLSDDFVRTFDAIDLSEKAKRKSAKSTNLRNSQYVVSLHRDSNSGILHLHINANRIDMDGNVNDAHFLFKRAMMAANAITEERGWVQAEVKREQNIKRYGDDCIAALKGMKRFSWEEYEKLLNEQGYSLVFKRDSDEKVRGYTVGRGKVLYKSSDLGHNRGLTPSRIVDTWKQLHQSEIRQEPAPKPVTHAPATIAGTQVSRSVPQSAKPESKSAKPEPKKIHLEIPVDRKVCSVDIPEEIYRLIMAEAKAPDPADCLWTELKDVQHTALLLFAGMVNEATTIAQNCGGGGGSASNDWGKKPDGDKEWARECLRRAHNLHLRSRGRGRGRH